MGGEGEFPITENLFSTKNYHITAETTIIFVILTK